MTRPSTALAQQLVHMQPGAHVCMLFDTREEQLRAVVPFIQEGLRRNELCVYIADAASTEQIESDLEFGGVDVQAALRAGGLKLLTARDAYLRDGRFNVESMINFWVDLVERAQNEGWSSVRATGEMTWALGPDSGGEELIPYEQRLNEIPELRGARLLCQYDRRRFSPATLRGVLHTHPFAIVGDSVHDNPFFQQPDASDGHSAEDLSLERMLAWVQQRTQRAVSLAELGTWALEQVPLNDLMNAAAHMIQGELGAQLVEIIQLDSPDEAACHVDGTEHPLVVTEWDVEDRVAQRPDLQALGVASSVAVPVRQRDGQPIYGMMWVHSTEPRIFTDDDIALVESVAAVLSQAIARQHTERELHALVDNSPDIIARFDRHLRLTFANLAMERVTGMANHELIGKTSREAGIPDSAARAWDLLLDQAWRTGREQTAELSLATPMGERQFHAHIMSEFDPSPGLGPDGSVQSVLMIARDITDLRQAEGERTELYRQLAAQQGRVTDLVSKLETAHEQELRRTDQTHMAAHLTRREREVLRLLTQGWTNGEIAKELQLSRGTVKNHVARILAVLDANDRTHAAVRAVQLGLASPT